ncbi:MULTISPECIES: hypothetical protein [unclassified Undibacterium]|uniref:hypothetical protein n=1 Tax=unclassified Undibacterium TaxID=2630295 RepID=UPI002AC9B1F5|nr:MULTISPECIES: hypothetical protein [unclassified Undibacterium]MEB0140648.1 hypothetical protein [Undibacterium sp. CCC2.1]MEB0172412.1 hypothetical protein [Undibacterium sp. CCC1.1]MEB0177698.1 hypothetical protein [Undibacterium sp. CCC3.4]MEB0215534.1 hypothetical protein [Undibacterium sp. 5I2]WPX43758.1 hypothetical protein RHM61_00525 [Undibacterium sp. CCC3.4]
MNKSRPSNLLIFRELETTYIKQPGAYWPAKVRRKGYKPSCRTFETQKQAQQWASHIESEMDSGLNIDRTEAERTTLRQGLEAYT